MSTLIIIVHVIVSVLLILIVLLQVGKGAGLSNLFGGGSGGDVLFTSAGGDVFLKRFTTVLAVIFFLTSLSLTIISSRRPVSSIMDKTPPVETGTQRRPGVDTEHKEQLPPVVPQEENEKSTEEQKW